MMAKRAAKQPADDGALWDKFCTDFESAIFKCAKDGAPTVMRLDLNESKVTIEVYREKKDVERVAKILDEVERK